MTAEGDQTAVTGRCLCGAVRFRFGDRPLLARACWCRDCQYLSSGNASISAVFRTDTLVVTGDLGEWVSLADSGRTMRRRFCRTCGTPVFSDAVDQPGFVAVRAGTLDNREIARPGSTIWTGSAPSWGSWDSGLPSFPRHVEAVKAP